MSSTASTPPPVAATQDVAGTASAIQQTSSADSSAKLSLQATQQSLQLQGTQLALQGTQSAMQQQPTEKPQPTQEPPTAVPPTEKPQPTEEKEPTIQPTKGADDYADQIKNAKILLYEDTSDLGIGQWIEETLIRMGLDYTGTQSYSGDFMRYLDSGTKWDLIIVGAEDHTAIQGEFWDVILEKAEKKTAVIAEVWYLDELGGGKIRKFTDECGVSYQRNQDLAESIYWVKPDHLLFNYPNTTLPLLHYNRYWNFNAGDRVRTNGHGDAQIVAGLTKFSTKDEGFITVCMGGRTVLQTFCNHDYRESEIKDLWENYITYTLINHFKALESSK
jgi:hypothetical protein